MSAFEAPPKFDPADFKWGSQSGSNLSLFAPASFGDNKLGSQAISPFKWDAPVNFGSNAAKDNGLKSHEQEEGESPEAYEGDQADEDDPEENGSDYNLRGLGLGTALPAPGGPSSFPFSAAAAFSPSAFPSSSAFPPVTSPFSPATFSATFPPSTFPATTPASTAFNRGSSTTFSTSAFPTSTFSTSAFASSTTSTFSTSAFASSTTSAFPTSTFSTSAFASPATSTFSTSAFASSTTSTFSTSAFSTSAFASSTTSTFATSTFSPALFSAATATASGTSATTTPAFAFAPTATFNNFSAFSSSASSTTTTSAASAFAPFGSASPASSTFTFHAPTSTSFSSSPAPFSMATSAFSTGTSMYGSNDEAKPTTSAQTSTFVSASALATTTAPFSFGSTPAFTSAFGSSSAFPASFGPNSFAPAAFAPAPAAFASGGGFLREPSFWSVEADAPVFNKNRGYVTKNTSVDLLEAKLQGWLKDAGVSPALIEEHRAAFAKFRKEYVPPKVAKHIFVQDAARAFRGAEHQALFIQLITYLEMKFKDYHQGLGLISAFLLLLTDPGSVIALVTKFNTDEKYAPGLWKAESVHSATDAYVYWELMAQHLPKQFASLKLKGITPELFYQKYFCALSVHLLPFESLFIYFGLYAKHGYKAVITFALNIVSHLSKQILSEPEQHELLELLRLERKDITDAACLAIVSDPKDWKLQNHAWFVEKRAEVFQKYLEKRMKSSQDAHKTVEQAPAAECGLCKALAELYCQECGIDICEDCADNDKGGHEQDEHTTYTQEEKPEVEEKEPPKTATAAVADLTAKTAVVSLAKPSAPAVAPAALPQPIPQVAASSPHPLASPQAAPLQASSVQAVPPAKGSKSSKAVASKASKPQTPASQTLSAQLQPSAKAAAAQPAARNADPNRALAALRASAPTTAAVLQALDKLTQNQLKVYNDSGIDGELRILLGDSQDKKAVERASQRVRKRADPRAYSDEEFRNACAFLVPFEERKELQEVLVGIRLFWQFTRTEMSAQFLHLETLIHPAPSLANIRKVYRKARKLEKIQKSGLSTPIVATAKAKLVHAQEALVSLAHSADWPDAVSANANLRHF